VAAKIRRNVSQLSRNLSLEFDYTIGNQQDVSASAAADAVFRKRCLGQSIREFVAFLAV